MYYEINIALNGSHFFATAKRSLTSKPVMLKVLKVIDVKFPVSEGYTIMVSEEHESGMILDKDEILKSN